MALFDYQTESAEIIEPRKKFFNFQEFFIYSENVFHCSLSLSRLKACREQSAIAVYITSPAVVPTRIPSRHKSYIAFITSALLEFYEAALAGKCKS